MNSNKAPDLIITLSQNMAQICNVFFQLTDHHRDMCANPRPFSVFGCGMRQRMIAVSISFVFPVIAILFVPSKVTFEIFSRWIKNIYIFRWSEAVWSSSTLNKKIIILFFSPDYILVNAWKSIFDEMLHILLEYDTILHISLSVLGGNRFVNERPLGRIM